MSTTKKNMKQIVAAVEYGEGETKRSYWTKIGVAFQNDDGSWNQLLDFVPTNLRPTTIQMRDIEPRENRDG